MSAFMRSGKAGESRRALAHQRAEMKYNIKQSRATRSAAWRRRCNVVAPAAARNISAAWDNATASNEKQWTLRACAVNDILHLWNKNASLWYNTSGNAPCCQNDGNSGELNGGAKMDRHRKRAK